jgi:hypothetical protein
VISGSGLIGNCKTFMSEGTGNCGQEVWLPLHRPLLCELWGKGGLFNSQVGVTSWGCHSHSRSPDIMQVAQGGPLSALAGRSDHSPFQSLAIASQATQFTSMDAILWSQDDLPKHSHFF